MVVHLFGAWSSPSYAMFAPRRISEDNQSKASPETVDIVFKNVCVDDCLKAREKKAIAMVKDFVPLESFIALSGQVTVVSCLPQSMKRRKLRNSRIWT